MIDDIDVMENEDVEGQDTEDLEDNSYEEITDTDIQDETDRIRNKSALLEKSVKKSMLIHNGHDEEEAELMADLWIRRKYDDRSLSVSDISPEQQKTINALIEAGYDVTGHEAELAVKLEYGLSPVEAADAVITEANERQEKKLASPDEKYRRMLSTADRKACDRLKVAQPDRKWTYKKYYNRLKEYGV